MAGECEVVDVYHEQNGAERSGDAARARQSALENTSSLSETYLEIKGVRRTILAQLRVCSRRQAALRGAAPVLRSVRRGDGHGAVDAQGHAVVDVADQVDASAEEEGSVVGEPDRPPSSSSCGVECGLDGRGVVGLAVADGAIAVDAVDLARALACSDLAGGRQQQRPPQQRHHSILVPRYPYPQPFGAKRSNGRTVIRSFF